MQPQYREAPRSNSLDLEFAVLSDMGRVRTNNEDYVSYKIPEGEEAGRDFGWLFVVADGVGGHDLGEVASKTAVETLTAGFQAGAAGETHSASLARLVQAANTRVYEEGRNARPGGVAMATTIVAAALRYDKVTVAHVGDSRCYLIRQGRAMSLTRDHTMVNEKVKLGIMSAKDAATAANKNILSRSIGADLFVNVDTSEHQLMPNDVLVLCTDGLHGAVTPSEIAAVAGHGANLHSAAKKLVALANANDGGDNVSVLLVRALSVERVGMYRGRPYKLR